MNLGVLMEWFDRMRTIPAQRWGLIAVAVSAAAAASTLTGMVAGHVHWFILAVVLGTAVAATAWPDLHTGLLVETILMWHWIAGTDDPLTPWAMPMALLVFAFHAGIALMSVAPARAIIDSTIVRQWSIRSGYVVVATVAVWLLVVVMDGRRAPGSVALTFVAFATLSGLVLAARVRSA